MAGGDWLYANTVFVNAADEAANPQFLYPNGIMDIRLVTPGVTKMTVTAHMYDVNTVTGVANTAANCCVQTRGAAQIPANCAPDPACSARYAPYLGQPEYVD